VTIYPNPTRGPLTIQMDKVSEAGIYSQEGRLIKKVTVQKGPTKLIFQSFRREFILSGLAMNLPRLLKINITTVHIRICSHKDSNS
jgi:hypothetical protein